MARSGRCPGPTAMVSGNVFLIKPRNTSFTPLRRFGISCFLRQPPDPNPLYPTPPPLKSFQRPHLPPPPQTPRPRSLCPFVHMPSHWATVKGGGGRGRDRTCSPPRVRNHRSVVYSTAPPIVHYEFSYSGARPPRARRPPFLFHRPPPRRGFACAAVTSPGVPTERGGGHSARGTFGDGCGGAVRRNGPCPSMGRGCAPLAPPLLPLPLLCICSRLRFRSSRSLSLSTGRSTRRRCG